MTSEIVLVNVSGRNRAGLMEMVTSAMARFQARILDVGQAVIHDELTLGVMLEVPGPQDPAALRQALQEGLREGLGEVTDGSVNVTPVSVDDYRHWVGQQGRPRYIVTLLTAGVGADQLAAVARIVEHHGLSIDAIRRLSGRVLVDVEHPGRASVELSLRGEALDPAALKADLLDAAGELTFDFSVQRDTVYRRNRRLVAFDMDSTLIDAEVIDELARRHGVGAEVSAITEQAMRGEIDFRESFRRRVEKLAGLAEATLAEVAQSVQLMDGAHRLTSALNHFGYTTAIISGGFRFVGERLCRELGIDHLFANELEVIDGRVTGAVRGDIIDAAGKAQTLREICAGEGIALAQAIAIGDGANDLPMLDAAGLGVAFHAKPVVRESASHAISNFGLDSVLYLLGFSDQDIEEIGS